ncbi:MAG TPA: DUF1501 domain-containing protein [Planctomycetota bacterium]
MACKDCPEDRLGLSRRTLLRNSVGGFLGYALARNADPNLLLAQEGTRAAGKSLIVLWMSGGPTQFETWSPLEGRENGGPTKALATSVKDIQYADNMKVCATQAEHIAVVRSMSSREGSHERGRYLLHTGYVPTGTVMHPSLGAITAMEVGRKELDLPNFISVGGTTEGAGFLSPEYNPFTVNTGGRGNGGDRRAGAGGSGIPNIAYGTGVDKNRFRERMKLLQEQEGDFEKEHASDEVTRHKTAYAKADKLMHTPLLEAFDLSKEKADLVTAYGDNPFGKGCLLARRLVERGVSCVEVNLGGWDTHQDNFTRVAQNCKQLDPGMGTLIKDLNDKGLLKNTMVLWMGEFGRTPKVNGNSGRDHYPRAWSVALAGGGIQGGRVVGATDKDGVEVKDRPVTVPDLFATVYSAMGVDFKKKNVSPLGRPIALSDNGVPVKELLS